jgi:hypothetical protein
MGRSGGYCEMSDRCLPGNSAIDRALAEKAAATAAADAIAWYDFTRAIAGIPLFPFGLGRDPHIGRLPGFHPGWR